jgi:hypothetical protein
MPIVEYFHRAPASEKAGKLPEWVAPTAILTGTTIFAFATSSFYVAGLAFILKAPLAIYFSLTDYLRITPSWAVPTLGFSALLFLSWVILVLREMERKSKQSTTEWRHLSTRAWFYGFFNWGKFCLKNRPRSFWRALFLAALGATPLFISFPLRGDRTFAIGDVFFASLTVLLYLVIGSSFVPVSIVVRALVVTVTWLLIFALGLGSLYAPLDIQEAPLARVLFESEKDRVVVVEGKVILTLIDICYSLRRTKPISPSLLFHTRKSNRFKLLRCRKSK